MRFSFNLVTRTIILTVLLILGQLAFILVLSDVLRESQERIEKQWRSENLIRLTFSICRAFSELVIFSHVPQQMLDVAGVDGPSAVSKAKRDMQILHGLASVDPLKRDAVVKLLGSAGVLTHTIELAIQEKDRAAGQPLSYVVPFAYRKIVNDNAVIFLDAVEEIVAIEKVQHKEAHSHASAFSALTATLVAAALASIVVAVILGFAYAVSIRRPLKHLSLNARLLSAQQALLPELKQNDEFGRLDALLHATSREVEATMMQERETIANAADFICVLDEEGDFKSVNPFAQKMLGIIPEALIGQNLHDLTVPEESLLADEQLRSSVQTSDIRQFELRLKTATGSVVDTRWSCLWSQAERMIFCVVRDVTEDKKIEQLKQDFANMISHDLRSPLMAMGNSFTLLKAGLKGELPEDALKRIDLSARNVEKLIVLVNDLLDFQKLKAGKMELLLEDASLQSIITDAADLLEETARDKNVAIELPEGDTRLLCDKNKLLQAAVNLISNAIKFSGENGKVTVAVRSTEDRVTFAVTDTGPGVPADFQQRIFEPFEQAPSGKKSEGTGLGLAICKLVVEAHGGTIRAENLADFEEQKTTASSSSSSSSGEAAIVSHGSVFTIELPRIGSSASNNDGGG